MTIFTPFEGMTLENTFGPQSELGRVPKLHLGDLEANFDRHELPIVIAREGIDLMIIFRIALTTESQLSELYGIGIVSARRIRKRLNALGFEPRRADETAAECLARLFGEEVRNLSIKLLYLILLDAPTSLVEVDVFRRYTILQILAALEKSDDMTMGELAQLTPDELLDKLFKMFDEYEYDDSADTIVRTDVPILFERLHDWGIAAPTAVQATT